MASGLPLRLTRVLSDARFKPNIVMFGEEWMSLSDSDLIQQLVAVSKTNFQMDKLVKPGAKPDSTRFKPYDRNQRGRRDGQRFLGDGRQKNKPTDTWKPYNKNGSQKYSGRRSTSGPQRDNRQFSQNRRK